MNPETKPSVRAALMRSWCLVDARISAHRMKPLPKSVDVTKWQATKRGRKAQGQQTFIGAAEPNDPTKESLSAPVDDE